MWFSPWTDFFILICICAIVNWVMSILCGTEEGGNKSSSKGEVSDDPKEPLCDPSTFSSSEEYLDCDSPGEDKCAPLDTKLKSEGESVSSDCAGEDICIPLGNGSETDMTKASKEFQLDNVLLSEDDLQYVERELTSYEKISLAFMYFEDVDVCLKYCSKFKNRYKYRGFIKFSKNIPPKKRSAVILECLYLLKNYYLLEKFGIDKYTAKNIFSDTSNINPDRKLLYQIFDSLTMNETKRVIASIDSLSNETHLEIFFLKLTESDQWMKVKNILHEIEAVHPFLCEFDKLVDSKLIEKPMDLCNSPTAPNVTQGPTPKSIDAYPIKDPNNVGLCLVINQLNFSSHLLPKRVGSEVDVEAIQNAMQALNFKVINMCDPTQLYYSAPIIHQIQENFNDNFSIFFLIIMSHGSEGVFFTSDSKPVSIQTNIFNILNHIPKLRGIPKVIVVQACQGSKFLKSNKIETDSFDFDPELLNVAADDNISDSRNTVGEYISDAILVMSTVPGFKAFRQIELGSYFIQAFCNCLLKYQDYNFVDIITEVISCVDSEVVVPTKIKNLNLSQQPLYTSLLKKKLYLKSLSKI